MDLREMLAKVGGLGTSASEEDVLRHIDQAAERVRSISDSTKTALASGVRGSTTKGALLTCLLGQGLVWSSKTSLALMDRADRENHDSTGDANNETTQWIVPGMVLREISCGQNLLWKEPGSAELVALWDSGGAEPPNPWDVLERLEEDAEVSCLFSMPAE